MSEQNSIVNVTVADILGIQNDLQSLLARMNKWGQQLTQLGVVALAPQVTAMWPPTAEAIAQTKTTLVQQALAATAPPPPDPELRASLDLYYTAKTLRSQTHQHTVVAVVIANRNEKLYQVVNEIECCKPHAAGIAGAIESLRVAREQFPRSMVTIHTTMAYFYTQANGQKPINANFGLWQQFNQARLTAKEAEISVRVLATSPYDNNPHRLTSEMLARQAKEELAAR